MGSVFETQQLPNPIPQECFDEIFELTPLAAMGCSLARREVTPRPSPLELARAAWPWPPPETTPPPVPVSAVGPDPPTTTAAEPTPQRTAATSPWTETMGLRKMEAKALAIIRAKGGEMCTMPSKEGRQKFVTVKCAKGHAWKVGLDRIIHRGEWCPTCRLNSREDSVLLWARGAGVFPTGSHVSTRETRAWICSKGHRFNASFLALRIRKNGNYCLRCKSSN